MNPKKKRIIIGILLGAVLLIGGIAAFSFIQFQGARSAQVDPTEIEVELGDIIVEVTDTGTVEAVRSVDVRSRASGRLQTLFVAEGGTVTANQEVALIDPEEPRLRYEQDRAQLDGASEGVKRSALEVEQRRRSSRAAFDESQARVRQIELELAAQPKLSSAEIRAAETQVASAEADRRRLVESIFPAARVSAENQVREAEASRTNARQELDRRESLVQKGFIAMRDVETAKLNLDLAEARLATARENLARLEAQQSAELAKADESVRSARASLDRARVNAVQDDIKKRQYEQALASMRAAEVALRDADALAFSRNQAQAQVRQLRSVAENSRVLLGETRVRAPFSGVVTRIFVEVGELITALSSFSAGTPILRIEDRSKMRVLMQINEIDVARLRVGTPAEIQVDALPDEIILGEVVRIASTKTEPAQGAASPVVRFEVEVEFAEVPDGVMSGMTAKCTMRVVELRNIVRIPLDYVGRDGDKTFVKIVREGAEEPERREVVLGPSSGAFVQVRTGLNAGERITRPEFDGPARQGLIQFGS